MTSLAWTGRALLRLRADAVRRGRHDVLVAGGISARSPRRAFRTHRRMTMDEQHIDGNGIAGLVGEIAARR